MLFGFKCAVELSGASKAQMPIIAENCFEDSVDRERETGLTRGPPQGTRKNCESVASTMEVWLIPLEC